MVQSHSAISSEGYQKLVVVINKKWLISLLSSEKANNKGIYWTQNIQNQYSDCGVEVRLTNSQNLFWVISDHSRPSSRLIVNLAIRADLS